jgi:hypothetical protein
LPAKKKTTPKTGYKSTRKAPFTVAKQPPTRTASEIGKLTKSQIVSELTRSSHGVLSNYVPTGVHAASQDPDFYSHLIAWNQKNGQVRDSKIALPVIALAESRILADKEWKDNALAHLAQLDPRNLVKAVRLAKSVQARGGVRKVVEAYLRAREANWPWWERAALSHRESMKELYALCHVKPSAMADLILFKNQPPVGTIFDKVRKLKTMTATEIAGTILTEKIPFLVAMGALGARVKETDVAMAIINQMSATELVTNTKLLERLGVKTIPVLKAAYEEALSKAQGSKKATFKTTRAAEAMDDGALKKKLQNLQEKQIQNLGGVEGNWLVLGDKSGSMQQAIEISKMVAATLSKMVKGEVHLVFFDVTPSYLNATGMEYEKIKEATKRVQADGGTSIGVGLDYILQNNIEVDGIAIITDGAENSAPLFAQVYRKYEQKFDKSPTVYVFRCAVSMASYTDVDISRSLKAGSIDYTEFDLKHGQVDFYSLPNIIQTMRTNKYSLVDEIMATPLLTLEEALKPTSMTHA